MGRGIVLGAALVLLYKDAEGQKRRAFHLEKHAFLPVRVDGK